MKILFAGTPEFAATALAALLDSSHSILAVYTQPDRPAGRGRKLQVSPVKRLAEAHNLRVFQPETLRDLAEQARLRDFGAEVMVVAAYGLILPKAVLAAPRLGCFNIHASLLPRWRGAAPIQRALLAGDSESGISIMRMQRRLDSGPLLLRRICPILHADTAATLHDRLAALGARAIIDALDEVARGNPLLEPQDDTQVTHAAKLDKAEAWLNWGSGAQELERQVRAFDPYPVAQTRSGNTVVRIWRADFVPANQITPEAGPGTILAVDRAGVSVASGNGILILRRIQLPGGRPLEIAEVLNAHLHLFRRGTILGGGAQSDLVSLGARL
ncbi:Methionyl-tRNA formyltransferase [Gammaproteobacteria bacterium]